MATVKVTFTLDEATISRLRTIASRLSKPRSQVVREAIRDFGERVGKLSELERLRMLDVFDSAVPRIPSRPASKVEAELREIRAARRGGGRSARTRLGR